ncbi:MAG TPA: hypothetical protein VMS81_00550 [Methanomicrobiales archaeon]|nr:hypothetical protein [Methanomicrobiales archaeon]
MLETNEYEQVIRQLSKKSLQLHNPSDFHPVLRFFFMDAIAHIDYTLGILAYNFMSIRNEMSREYLRWRIDEEEKGDRARFPAFVNWLKKNHPDSFEKLPTVWRVVYDEENVAQYMSFRLVIDPDSKMAIPAGFFYDAIQEFFAQPFLMSLYSGSKLSRLLDEFLQTPVAGGAPQA